MSRGSLVHITSHESNVKVSMTMSTITLFYNDSVVFEII